MKVDIKNVVEYIDNRFKNEEHTNSKWVMPNKEKKTEDVGYAEQWWNECMREELLKMNYIFDEAEKAHLVHYDNVKLEDI